MEDHMSDTDGHQYPYENGMIYTRHFSMPSLEEYAAVDGHEAIGALQPGISCRA